MAWHSAGTYRIGDVAAARVRARSAFALSTAGGQRQLDKARRLIWPIKQKYGNKISWADLMILAPTSAWRRWASRRSASASRRESGSPRKTSTGAPRTLAGRRALPGDRQLDSAGAVQMGLIYVNPRAERPARSAGLGADIRETFGAHGHERRGDRRLIAGGHTSARPTARAMRQCRRGAGRGGHRRAGPGMEEQLRERQGRRRHHQRPGGAWTPNPIKWTTAISTSCSAMTGADQDPAGANQWTPKDAARGPGAGRPGSHPGAMRR